MQRKNIKKIKIGLVGNYGHGNVGDETLALIFSRRLIQKGYYVKLFLQTDKYISEEMKNCPNLTIIKVVGRKGILINISKILDINFLMFGGGGIINDYYRATPNWVYLWYIISKVLKIPLIFLSIGIGPIKTVNVRNQYLKILQSAFFISLRDQSSGECLTSLDPKITYKLSTDGVFLQNKWFYENKNLKNNVIISFRKWNFSDFSENMLVDLVKFILDDNKKIFKHRKISLVIFEEEDIEPLLFIKENIMNKFQVQLVHLNGSSGMHIFNDSYLTIGMRFHSLVFSALNYCPFVGLSYDKKVESITGEFVGKEAIVEFCSNPYIYIEKAVNYCLGNYDSIVERMKILVAENREMAENDFINLCEKIGNSMEKFPRE